MRAQLADGAGTIDNLHLKRRDKDVGAIAFTEPLHIWSNSSQFATNSAFGLNMNVNGAFSGTPEVVHNGIDSVAWTASSITGGKFTFDSTDRFQAGTKSIKTDNGAIGDTMQFNRGSEIDLNGYVAITMWINVDKDWKAQDSISIIGWDVATGTARGTAVLLESYFNQFDFDVWQKISIPLGDMTLGDETLIGFLDAFRIQIVGKEGKSPKFYIDTFQIEEVGVPAEFRIEAPSEMNLRVSSLEFSFVDEYDSTLANSSMPKLSYNQILSIPKLENGIVLSRVIDGETLFSANVTCLQEFMRISGNIVNLYSDAENTGMTIRIIFDEPILLGTKPEDYIAITISDDLTDLISFTTFASGSIRPTC